MNDHSSQRGSGIIFAILMTSVILLITLTLANIFIPRLKSVRDSVHSVQAFFVADSAAEDCLYTARHEMLPNPGLTLPTGATYTIASLSAGGDVPLTGGSNDCTDLSSASFLFRAVGSFRNVNRALEVSQ